MDPALETYLKNLEISYEIHEHPAAFTVEEHHTLVSKTPGVLHTKNLFLKDEAKNFYLVCMYANKRLDLKSLPSILHAKKKLSFASPEQLKEKLNLTPGSVSIFGMVHAKPHSVALILDNQVWQADKVGFHPNVNTATLELSHADLKKFYDSLKADKQILEL